MRDRPQKPRNQNRRNRTIYLSPTIQLSRDHSLVEDLLRDGQLTADEAAVHPKRNIITRALGIDVDVDVDGAQVIPFNGDRFLLCSDGLFGEVSEDQISSVLRRLAEPGDAADELVRLANEVGGRDNITVVIVEVLDDDGRSLAAAKALEAEQSRLKAREAGRAASAGAAVDGDEPATEPVADADAPADTPPRRTTSAGDPYVPVFVGRKSSLPDATDDYGAEIDDPFYGMEGLDSKRFTWRVAVFGVALVAVVIVVIAATLFSARNTYYVGFEGEKVAVYKGKPDGVLWIDPKLDHVTQISRDDLPEDIRSDVDAQKEFGSEAAALRYELQLEAILAEDAASTTTTTTTTSTTTTTTAPASTTSTTSTTQPAVTTTAGP